LGRFASPAAARLQTLTDHHYTGSVTALRDQRRVWIVDDSPLDAQRARQILAGEYDVQVFQDGSAALERLASHEPPHVMVLDWVMPGITGLEVCRFLRSGPENHPQIGILLLTSQRNTSQIVEGLSAGANDYLAKPYEAEELRARVMSQIRAQELLERALRAEERNRRFLESAPDPMIVVDSTERVTFVNQEGCRVLKVTPAALLGQPLARAIPNFPSLPSAVSTDETSRALPDVTLEGRLFSPTIRVPASQETETTTISLREVTAQREKENRRLDFYSIIAHDLRTPLNSISLRTQLILNGRRGALSRELSDDMVKIDAHIGSLVLMINDFLELARSDAAPLITELADVDLGRLIETTMEGLQPQLETRRLEWRSLGSEEGARHSVRGDARRLSQVFANLLGNAIKFTPPGGVITTRIQRLERWLEVSVEDTGPGVPREAMLTLFERFTRAAGSAASVPGSGLGLMIVRDIIEAHGGSVGLDEQRSEGSRFWVRLPSP
jgi:signal transduction histidine kinase